MTSGPREAADESAAAPPSGSEAEPRQLALELPFATGRDLADFLPAPCNRAALDAVLRWPDWPVPVLVLSGPPASGKTHLARIWAGRAAALVLGPAELVDSAAALRRAAEAGAAPCVVDDADDAAVNETVLFHLHNAVVGRGGTLLLTATLPPVAWPIRLPDLRSRLRAAWSVRIEPPDDTLLAALLVKQFADRQLRVEPAVIDYLVARIERSFAAMREVVDAVDRTALREQRPVTLPLVRSILRDAPPVAGSPSDEGAK